MTAPAPARIDVIARAVDGVALLFPASRLPGGSAASTVVETTAGLRVRVRIQVASGWSARDVARAVHAAVAAELAEQRVEGAVVEVAVAAAG
jgi:hypothetical protein